MSISNAEWEIMRVVWTQGETTSSMILTVLNQKKTWSASTVKTLLKRLLNKGYLHACKEGKGFTYHAIVDETTAMTQQLDEVLQKFCQTKHYAILEHLILDCPLTPEQVSALQLRLAEKETVPVVSCNCTPGQCLCQEHLQGGVGHGH
ncbi:MAG: CopY/TcrY family copper transport repressor [Streptococcus pyogenes]|nr:MAG: CopY/TcrY family copper transport repressor [Streptococcus pyogenes]